MSQKSGNNGLMFGKFPAVIKSYDASSRECVIQTPVGDEVDAEIEYPIGDDSANTEIRILVGDKVWCEFIQGDTRRALITGYRNPRKGNSSGTRRFYHDNIELIASGAIKLIAGGNTVTITGGGTDTPNDVVAGGVSVIGHDHTEQGDGQPTSPPN